jgi:hypothetical protein
MAKPAQVRQDNAFLLQTQQHFRRAADVVAQAWSTFPEVNTIAVIGSVAKPLWQEVPRFTHYRRRGRKLWHECKDLDLALWLDDQSNLGELRRAKAAALRAEHESHPGFGVADHQVDIFLFEPETNVYLGRLCNFNRCPKGRPECAVPGCGEVQFMRQFEDFDVHSDIFADAAAATLYTRDGGILRSALTLPGPVEER